MLNRSRTKYIPVRKRFGYFFSGSGAGAGAELVPVVGAGFGADFGGNEGHFGGVDLFAEGFKAVGRREVEFVPPASGFGSSFFSASKSFRSLSKGSMVHLETT